MIGVIKDNYKLRLEQIEAITKLVRIAQVTSIIEQSPENDPIGELIQEMAMDIARYNTEKSLEDQTA